MNVSFDSSFPASIFFIPETHPFTPTNPINLIKEGRKSMRCLFLFLNTWEVPHAPSLASSPSRCCGAVRSGVRSGSSRHIQQQHITEAQKGADTREVSEKLFPLSQDRKQHRVLIHKRKGTQYREIHSSTPTRSHLSGPTAYWERGSLLLVPTVPSRLEQRWLPLWLLSPLIQMVCIADLLKHQVLTRP